MIVLALLLILLVPAITSAQMSHSAPSGMQLRDEGVVQGQVDQIDCVGLLITCTKSGPLMTLTISGAGGGSLTVQEVDGSPSVSSVTTLEFDQATGLIVTDQTGGVARVSASVSGGLSHPQVMTRAAYGF